MLKKLRYLIEYIIVKIALGFFLLFKPQKASDLGAKIAKFVGKKISVNKLAYKNISNALPDLSEHEKLKILDDMWDNLGRIVGEYGHIAKFSQSELENYYTISEESKARLEKMLSSKKGGIVFGAHLGNWEIGPKIFLKYGLNISTVYRPLNNPYVEKLTAKMRGVDLIGKSTKGSRKIVTNIKNGSYVIILADQKVTEGKAVQFFNDLAITTTSIARIALKYDIDLIPARSVRIDKKFKFMVETTEPLKFEKSDDFEDDVLRLTRKINMQIEDWIKEYPSQWFWVHNRWKR